MVRLWPVCWTEPENVPSAAIVNVPLQFVEPLRVAAAVNQLSLELAIA